MNRTDTTPNPNPGTYRQNWLMEQSMPLTYAVLFLVLSLTVENFFSTANIVGLMLSVAQIGMVACTMMLCLASRDFDLSVGSTIAFSGVLGAIILERTQSITLAVAGGLLAGALIGAGNGILIAYLRVNALIATLATMLMVRGLAFIVSGGQAVGIANESFIDFGDARILGLPLPVLMTAACFVVFGVLLNHTIFGRNTLAIGGNPEAARLAGVNVEKLRVWIFLLQGLNLSRGQQKSLEALKQGDPGGLVAFWATPDRIDMATKGTIFGMDVTSLLAMQSSGPINMLRSMLPPAAVTKGPEKPSPARWHRLQPLGAAPAAFSQGART